MKTLRQLKEERALKLEEQRAIPELATKEKRALTPKEKSRFEELDQEIDLLESELRVAERKESIILNRGLVTSSEEWVDRRSGNPIQVYSRGQKMAAPKPGEGELRAGRAILNMINGVEGPETRFLTTSAGGAAMLPKFLSDQIIDLAREKSIVSRLGLRAVSMENGNMSIARVTGGLTAAYHPEGEIIPEQDPVIGSILLEAKTSAVRTSISRELAAYAPNAERAIMHELAQAIADEVDRGFFMGAGTVEDPWVGLNTLAGVQTLTAVGELTYAALIAAAVKVRNANAMANGAVISPNNEGALALVAGSDGHYVQAPKYLDNLKIESTTRLDDTRGFVGDFDKAFLAVGWGLLIETTTHGAGAFERHLVGIKATMSYDFGFEQPSAFVKMTGIA